MLEGLLFQVLFGRVSGPDADLERLLEQPVRRRLLSMIDSRPGIYASEIAREVDESWGTVQYHLQLLRKADLVNSVVSGRERRFYPDDMDGPKARLLSLLHQGRRPEILDYIRRHPGQRQVDICDALDVSRKTFRTSVRPLVEEGFVEERRGLQSHRYFVTKTLDRILSEE